MVTARSVEGVCVATIALENACRDQLLLMSFSKPKRLDDIARPGDARMENPYRPWPFFLYKNGVQSRDQIKAELELPGEGEIF